MVTTQRPERDRRGEPLPPREPDAEGVSHLGDGRPDAFSNLQPLPSPHSPLFFLLLVLSLSYTLSLTGVPHQPHKMSPTPNPLFKFNRDGLSVHISNIADAGLWS